MRKITLEKFDVISTLIFTYVENYTKYTEEEKRLERENRVGNA
jgi:diphthamide biosynthesis methyltransferase